MADSRKEWDDLVARLHAEGLVASELGLSGNDNHFFCPRCQPKKEGNPELKLKAAHFHCYRCDTEGDLISLIEFSLHTDRDNAIDWLKDRSDLVAPSD